MSGNNRLEEMVTYWAASPIGSFTVSYVDDGSNEYIKSYICIEQDGVCEFYGVKGSLDIRKLENRPLTYVRDLLKSENNLFNLIY